MVSSILISALIVSFALKAACYPVDENSVSDWSNIRECSQDSFTVVSDDNGIWPYREYQTQNATSPQFLISHHGKSDKASGGLIFLTVENGGIYGYLGVKQQRALMMSTQGDLVWAGPEGQTSNFRSQMLRGKPVITYWVGAGAAASGGGAAHSYGAVKILNTRYETMYSVCPKLKITFPPGMHYSCVADVHESYITPHNTILVTVYNITQADLRSVRGPRDGWVYDPLAVEVDLETNEPLFIWSPLKHVPINSSHVALGSASKNKSYPYDWFHMNSIQPHDGHYLINSRQTWTSYYVNRRGKIIWQIDGETGGDYGGLPPNGHFSWQHDVRIHSTNANRAVLTLFADDNTTPFTKASSVGLALLLDLPPRNGSIPQIQAHLVDPQDHVFAYAEGSHMTLANGNHLVGCGVRPVFKEFGADAEVLTSVQFGYVNNNNTASSYRVYKQEWHAPPSSKPSLVVRKSGARDGLRGYARGSTKRAYVSWNGATDVTGYAVYGGVERNGWRRVGDVEKKGFETEFVVPEKVKYLAVAALEGGKEVGRSPVVKA